MPACRSCAGSRSCSRSARAIEPGLSARIEALGADRRRGASALARDAVEILADAPVAARGELAARIGRLRPAMPAIGEMAKEAAGLPDPRQLLERVEAEQDRVAAEAARAVRPGAVVATISSSSMVLRVLRLAHPRLVQVHVTGAGDEGLDLVGILAEEGLDAAAVDAGRDSPPADFAVVGCDALFDDGGFVNRRGTADLVVALAPRPTLVVGDRWRRVGGPTPAAWPEAEMFEVVSPWTTVIRFH